jgi:hypothetical protein
VFHLVPLCPFSCQMKDFNTTFSQPELVSSVPFPYVPLIWTKIDARDSVRHCSLLSLLLWSEDQITFTEIICAEQSPLFRFAGSFGLQEAQQCWELVFWNLDFLMEIVCWRNYVVAILGFEYWLGDFVSNLWINFVFYLSLVELFLLLICHSNFLCFPYTLLISFLGSVGRFQDFDKLSSCV